MRSVAAMAGLTPGWTGRAQS